MKARPVSNGMTALSFSHISTLRAMLNESRSILLVPGATNPFDTLAASLGLATALAHNGRNVKIFYPLPIPQRLEALDFSPYLLERAHEAEYISSKLSFFDCMIMLGIPSLEHIGPLGEAPAEFFALTPIINIDVNSENARYGTLALCDPTLSSCAELCAHILGRMWPSALPHQTATAFLAGMLLGTDAFRSSPGVHQTMLAGARLMSRGADYRQLVRHIYKTKPASLIRLMGKLLARAEWNKHTRLFASYLTWRDMHEEHASPSLIPLIMQDIARMWPNARYALIAWEDSAPFAQTPSRIRALVHTRQEDALDEFVQKFGGIKKKNYLALATLAHNSQEAVARIRQAINRQSR